MRRSVCTLEEGSEGYSPHTTINVCSASPDAHPSLPERDTPPAHSSCELPAEEARCGHGPRGATRLLHAYTPLTRLLHAYTPLIRLLQTYTTLTRLLHAKTSLTRGALLVTGADPLVEIHSLACHRV